VSVKVSNTEVDGNETEELLPVTAIELILRCVSVVYRIDALVSDGVDTVAGGINPVELTAIVPSKPVPFTVIEEFGCTAEKLVKDGGGGGGGVLLTLPPEAPPPPQADSNENTSAEPIKIRLSITYTPNDNVPSRFYSALINVASQ
jgi:hypothetical protein